MTSLKDLAERARDAEAASIYSWSDLYGDWSNSGSPFREFIAAASPAAILALLAKNERLRAEGNNR